MSAEGFSNRSWRVIAVAVLAGVLALGFGFGFLLLPRQQGGHGPSSAADSVYHALGLHTHSKSFNTVQPPPKVSSYVAWTEATTQQTWRIHRLQLHPLP
jgi:hypothetical protein